MSHFINKASSFRYIMLHSTNKASSFRYIMLHSINKASTFRYIMLHSINKASLFRYIMLYSINKASIFRYIMMHSINKASTFILPITRRQILDSKLKECSDDNFKFDENGSKLSKRVENIVTSNFSFSHSVFKRLVSQGCQKVSLCGNGLNSVTFRDIT